MTQSLGPNLRHLWREDLASEATCTFAKSTRMGSAYHWNGKPIMRGDMHFHRYSRLRYGSLPCHHRHRRSVDRPQPYGAIFAAWGPKAIAPAVQWGAS